MQAEIAIYFYRDNKAGADLNQLSWMYIMSSSWTPSPLLSIFVGFMYVWWGTRKMADFIVFYLEKLLFTD